jgi:hypothetical protein
VKFGKNLGLGVVLRFVLLKHFDRLSLFDLLPLTLWIYLKNTWSFDFDCSLCSNHVQS